MTGKTKRAEMKKLILLSIVLALGLAVVVSSASRLPVNAHRAYDVAALDVILSVKENAGVGIDGYPTSAVIPLPQGQYTTTENLGLVSVPSQVEALERWPQDGSLRHVQVHFRASVPATGTVDYHLASSGRTDPATPVTVEEGGNVITVTTGPLRFTVSRTAFNIFDQVWLDQNENGVFESGERIIASHSQNGGVFTPRAEAGATQYDTARSDLAVDVEERGPMRAVIRVEAPTQFITTTQHTHGFAARIYAYAGKPYVKVDYQLQNSAKNVRRSWPLYFEALNLDFRLALGAQPTVTIGLGDGSVYQTRNTAGAYVAQTGHNAFAIYAPTLAYSAESVWNTSRAPDGFLDVSDAQRGVTAVLRDFWQRWPNGLAVDSQNRLTLQLFPDWSAQWFEHQISPTGLYWLEDMQHVYKEALLYFHGPSPANAELINLARTFQYYPVAVAPTDWYRQTRATFDLGGVIPLTSTIPTPADRRRPVYATSWYSPTGPYYGFNWVNFGDPEPGYRSHSCTTGGWPYGLGEFAAGGQPGAYFEAEGYGMGEVNVRPESMAQYVHDADWERLRLTENPYCGGTWRVFDGHGVSIYAAPRLPETGTESVFDARDDEHGWFYHVMESYWQTGNPWVKDWYQFIAEFRRVRLEHLDPWPDHSSRATGHSLNHVIQAYRVTGDETLLTRFRDHIRAYLRPDQDPYYGDQLESVESTGGGFQTGFLMRTIVDYLEEVRGKDWQAYAEGFNYLSGLMEWNYTYGNFPYYFDARDGGEGASSGSGLTLVDPQAWYYWHTGKIKYLDHIEEYMTTGINGGNTPYGNFSDWSGQYEGRYYLYAKGTPRTDVTPPVAITDLDATWLIGSATLPSSTVRLEWTAPADAARYHVVYSDKPIVEPNSTSANVTNWWAAYAIGPDLMPVGGQQQSLTFTPVFTGPCYVAMFSFDQADNMSAMSNVVRVMPGDWKSIFLPLVLRGH
jgi:hypothetical protein